MNKSIIIIRHGETEENEENRSRGWNTSKLDKKGIKQAGLLGDKFKNKGIKLIVSSDLPRAVETAGIIAKKTGSKVVDNPGLRTWNIGRLTGKKTDKIEGMLIMYKHNPSKKVPGGESYGQFKSRAMKALDTIDKVKEKKAVVVHNEVARLLNLKMQPGTSVALKKGSGIL